MLLEDLKKAKAEYLRKIATDGKTIVLAAIEYFFQKHPEVKFLRWTQYTPYFNDGEPCEFGVGDIYGSIVSLSEFDSEEYWEDNKNVVRASDVDYDTDDWYKKHPECIPATWPNLKDAMSDLLALSKDLHDCEDVMEIAFGDHVQVTVFNDPTMSVDIEDYEHE